MHLRSWSIISIPMVLLFACGGSGGGGSSGGSGIGNPIGNLAAIGLIPNDLADVAGATMASTIGWVASDTAFPVAPSCPSFVLGPDDDQSGHADTLTVQFDCTDVSEGLTLEGSLILGELADPQQFLTDLREDCAAKLGVQSMGLPEWGMSGIGHLTGNFAGRPPFDLTFRLMFAEFPGANKIAFHVDYTFNNFVVAGDTGFLVSGDACFTLPADNSSEIPTGFVNTFFFGQVSSAEAALECELLPTGRVNFELFGSGSSLLARGVIDPAAPEGSEVTFN